jgi:hypothetical protein
VWPGNSCAPLLRASGDPAGPALDPCPNDGDSFVAPESAGHILLRDFQRSGTWFDYDTGRNAYTGMSCGGLPPAISGTTMVVAGATVGAYTFPAMTAGVEGARPVLLGVRHRRRPQVDGGR